MENQPAKTRRKENGSIHESDRISELCQPILHQVLSFLSQKEAARTCLLSKTWRYLGSTRPKIDLCAICDYCFDQSFLGETKFCENCFGGNKKAFLSVLDETLQRYHDQKLTTQEFRLRMLNVDPESISPLEKWVPQLISPYFAVKTFEICFFHKNWPTVYFDIPSEVLYIKSLEKLCLRLCSLNKIDLVDKVIQLNRLQTLSLDHVLIADETLGKIISNTPLIENVKLEWCESLRTVKLTNKQPNMKHFSIIFSPLGVDCQRVEMDAPALETIKIGHCPNWYLHNKYLRNLKSLRLTTVDLSSEFFENFSSKFPCLEELYICGCIDFDEFHLSSSSIKHLTIVFLENSTKATIDAPNILYFKISGHFAPSKLSFTKIPSDCKLVVDVCFEEDSGYDVLPWFKNLYKLLGALGQSHQITLETSHDRLPDHETIGGFVNEPIVVEHLCLSLRANYPYSSPSLPDFLNGLFRICRPRYADVCFVCQTFDIPLFGFLCTVLVEEREQRVYHWQHDLEEVEMEFWDKNAKQWNPTTLEEFRLLNKEKIRFRLKWRD